MWTKQLRPKGYVFKKEIGLCAQNVLINLSSIVNMIWGDIYDHLTRDTGLSISPHLQSLKFRVMSAILINENLPTMRIFKTLLWIIHCVCLTVNCMTGVRKNSFGRIGDLRLSFTWLIFNTLDLRKYDPCSAHYYTQLSMRKINLDA